MLCLCRGKIFLRNLLGIQLSLGSDPTRPLGVIPQTPFWMTRRFPQTPSERLNCGRKKALRFAGDARVVTIRDRSHLYSSFDHVGTRFRSRRLINDHLDKVGRAKVAHLVSFEPRFVLLKVPKPYYLPFSLIQGFKDALALLRITPNPGEVGGRR